MKTQQSDGSVLISPGGNWTHPFGSGPPYKPWVWGLYFYVNPPDPYLYFAPYLADGVQYRYRYTCSSANQALALANAMNPSGAYSYEGFWGGEAFNIFVRNRLPTTKEVLP